MSRFKRLLLIAAGWVALITGLHLWLNFDWRMYADSFKPRAERKIIVGYLPVT